MSGGPSYRDQTNPVYVYGIQYVNRHKELQKNMEDTINAFPLDIMSCKDHIRIFSSYNHLTMYHILVLLNICLYIWSMKSQACRLKTVPYSNLTTVDIFLRHSLIFNQNICIYQSIGTDLLSYILNFVSSFWFPFLWVYFFILR